MSTEYSRIQSIQFKELQIPEKKHNKAEEIYKTIIFKKQNER